MMLLNKGNYLGLSDHSFNTDHLSAALTYYPMGLNAGYWHAHETFVMSMVLKGGNLEKRKNKEVERVAGVVTYHDAGDLHRSTSIVTGSRHINLEITNEFIKMHELDVSADTLEKNSQMQGKFLLLKTFRELMLADSETGLNIESMVLKLCKLPRIATKKYEVPNWVSKIKEALHDKWNEKITLHELAIIADLHPVNVSAYFSKYFGSTIGDYKRKIKIDKAIGLMQSNQLNLTQISYECGFADQSHFIRVFTEITGWPPKKLYRYFKDVAH